MNLATRTATRIKAIPTMYGGVQFRSRLEARWAAFFDLVEWRWEYEPLDLDGYVPDFVLRFVEPIAVEIKPLMWTGSTDEEDIIAAARSRFISWGGEAMLLGASVNALELTDPGFHGDLKFGELREMGRGWVDVDGAGSWDLAFSFLCRECGRKSFAHRSMSWGCRVSGCHDGRHHIDHEGWNPVEDFRTASNRVQWRAPR